MAISTTEGITRRKQAFEEMVRSYARKKGYELHYYSDTTQTDSCFTFINGTFKAVVDIRWLDPIELYDMYNRTVQYVEAQLEPSKHVDTDFVAYSKFDVEMTRRYFERAIKNKMNSYFGWSAHNRVPKIKDVIFNYPATIVFWTDGTKTVVKCQNGEEYDPEKGLAMAISKKALGNKRDYYHTFLKWLKKYDKEQKAAIDAWLNATISADEASSLFQNLAKKAKDIPFPGDSNGD